MTKLNVAKEIMKQGGFFAHEIFTVDGNKKFRMHLYTAQRERVPGIGTSTFMKMDVPLVKARDTYHFVEN